MITRFLTGLEATVAEQSVYIRYTWQQIGPNSPTGDLRLLMLMRNQNRLKLNLRTFWVLLPTKEKANR